MALLLRFGFAAQVIAAFVIFVLGYVGLFAALMLVMLVVRGLYESIKWLSTSAPARALANRFTPATATPDGVVFDRRIPLSITSRANDPQLAELSLHPALNRRRVAANYSSNLPGGTPR
jgi:hypothetical protein